MLTKFHFTHILYSKICSVGCFFVFFGFVCFAPNYLGHTDNYIEANAMVTPAHIVPGGIFYLSMLF